MKKRLSEEQIIGFLREAEAGLAMKDLYRRHGFSKTSHYLWRAKFGGMSVPDAKRLKHLETENAQLKKLPAGSKATFARTVTLGVDCRWKALFIKKLAFRQT